MTIPTVKLLAQMGTSNNISTVRHYHIEPSNHEDMALSTRGAFVHTRTVAAEPLGAYRVQQVSNHIDIDLIDTIEVAEDDGQSITLVCRTVGDLTVTRIRLRMSPAVFFSAVCAGERDDEIDA